MKAGLACKLNVCSCTKAINVSFSWQDLGPFPWIPNYRCPFLAPSSPRDTRCCPRASEGRSQPNPHGVRKQRGFSALPPSRGSDGSSVCPPLARWVLWVLCSSQTGPVHGAHPSTACASPPPCLCLSRGPGLCSAEHQGGELCWSGCLL